MKLVVLEGPIDLQFFKSFLTKQMKSRVITSENIKYVYMFKNLLAENPEMAKVEILSIGDDMLILLSIGSKGNFKIIAEAIKPLISTLRKEGENLNSILFIADKDAESEVTTAREVIRDKFEGEDRRINVGHILYIDYLEDLILEIVKIIAKKSPEDVNIEVLRNLLSIIEKQYLDDKYLYKRKFSIIHAVIGPRCFGHLFDEVFKFFDNPDPLLQRIDVLSVFTKWLTE